MTDVLFWICLSFEFIAILYLIWKTIELDLKVQNLGFEIEELKNERM